MSTDKAVYVINKIVFSWRNVNRLNNNLMKEWKREIRKYTLKILSDKNKCPLFHIEYEKP